MPVGNAYISGIYLLKLRCYTLELPFMQSIASYIVIKLKILLLLLLLLYFQQLLAI